MSLSNHPNHLRPNPRTLLGRSLAFSFSQSEAAMSCLHGQVRWQASVAAVYFTRRSHASLHNLHNILSPLRGSATAPYIFTEQHPRPLRHRGRRHTISYALGTLSCRRFASSRGTKRSIYDRFMEDLFPKNNIHFTSSYLPDNKRLQSTTNAYSTAWS